MSPPPSFSTLHHYWRANQQPKKNMLYGVAVVPISSYNVKYVEYSRLFNMTGHLDEWVTTPMASVAPCYNK